MTSFVRRGSPVLLSALLVATALACGGSNNGQEATNPPNGEDASAGSCASLSNAASSEVSNAIAAHQACAVDADCVQIGFAASCFDSCSRVVAKNGVADVTAAKDRVNADACKQFLAQGCKFDIPPCAPPGMPVCKAGACSEQ